MNEKQIKETINKIINDRISGSTYIASKIEKIFPYISENIFIPTIAEFLETHSSMASVINKINLLCLQKEGKIKYKTRNVSKKAYRLFWKENQKRKNWVTLSMSHSVIECFKYQEKKQNIIQGISYPDMEGLNSFRKLRKYHHTTILEDNKLTSEIEHSDGVVLGADMISENYVVNKTGSFSLALAANYFNKPLYIISSGEKFLSENLFHFFKIKTTKQNSLLIHYFERVPIKWITKIYLTSQKCKHPISSSLTQILLAREQ